MSTDADHAWVAAFVALEATPDHVAAWVDRIASAVLGETSELARDAELAAMVTTTVRDQWQAFLATLAEDRPEPVVVPSAAEVAAELARRHVDLPVLLAAYRAAQREAWAYAIEVARLAPPGVDATALLVDFWTRAGRWLDRVTEASILVHQEERRRIRHSGTAQRFEVVRALLAGEDPDARDLATALGGYPLAGPHTAVLLRATTPDATVRLEPLAHTLAGHVGGLRPLLVEPGGRELWMWLSTAATDAVQVPEDRGVHVAIGGPARGPDGFVTAHQEALAAQQVAAAQPAPPALTRYDDVAALALLARDPATAARFVARTLGALADDVPGRDRLRETVRVFLASAGVEEAARTLGVHKNTVRYRLGQAEDLLGRPLSERRGDLDLALRYDAAFGRRQTGN